MNVLSCFDGMSCGRIALDKLGIQVDNYYASEVDKYAIQIAKKNYPDTHHVGDVTKVKGSDIPVEIDLLMGGSPCQGFSFAGKNLNFDDPRSKLFFEFVRLLKELKPKYFLLENVRMKQESQDVISEYLGVQPIVINSNLVSAQNRHRLYWTNIPVESLPEDKGIMLKDILLDDAQEPMLSNIYGRFGEKKPRVHFDKSVTIVTAGGGGHIPSLIHTPKALDYMNREVKGGRTHWDFKHHHDIQDDKSSCITANLYKGVPYNVLVDAKCVRKLHPVECERLQTVPEGYTEGVSNTQRYRMLGNGWTVDVISHIFGGLLSTQPTNP